MPSECLTCPAIQNWLKDGNEETLTIFNDTTEFFPQALIQDLITLIFANIRIRIHSCSSYNKRIRCCRFLN